MYRALFQTFVRECVAAIAAGERLSDNDAAAFRAYLDARECSGVPLLGRFAGQDLPFDTVSGRCGHRPTFTDITS